MLSLQLIFPSDRDAWHILRSPFRFAALVVILAAAIALSISACNQSPSTEIASGEQNLRGGPGGSSYYGIESMPVTALRATNYSILHGGFMMPPLELDRGRLASIISGSGSIAPSVVLLGYDTVLWQYSFKANYPVSGLAADSAGRIYTVTGNGDVVAISSEGKKLWMRRIDGRKDTMATTMMLPTSPFAMKEAVVVGSSRGVVVCFDGLGNQRWRVYRGGGVPTRPVVLPSSGAIVAGITNNNYSVSDSIVALNPATGATIWAAGLLDARLIAGPVASGGRVFAGIATLDLGLQAPALVALDAQGRVLWRVPLALTPRGISVDGVGNCYVACAGTGTIAHGGLVVSFDSTGHRRWQVNLGSGVAAPVAITSTLLHFVARRAGRTGLYSYDHDGNFRGFVSIDMLPDVLSEITVSSEGVVLLSGIDVPAILRGR